MPLIANGLLYVTNVEYNAKRVAGGRGGYSTKFYYDAGRLRPEAQPLTLLYTIFDNFDHISIPLYYYTFH